MSLKNKKLSARYIYDDYNLGCDEYIGLVNNAYTARVGDKWGHTIQPVLLR